MRSANLPTSHRRDDHSRLTPICPVARLVPGRGVAALVEGAQVAIFRMVEDGVDLVFAIDHHDPVNRANVLGRGIVGASGDRWYVASPMHKQRFDLRTGECLDDASVRVRTWSVAIVGGIVHVGA